MSPLKGVGTRNHSGITQYLNCHNGRPLCRIISAVATVEDRSRESGSVHENTMSNLHARCYIECRFLYFSRQFQETKPVIASGDWTGAGGNASSPQHGSFMRSGWGDQGVKGLQVGSVGWREDEREGVRKDADR